MCYVGDVVVRLLLCHCWLLHEKHRNLISQRTHTISRAANVINNLQFGSNSRAIQPCQDTVVIHRARPPPLTPAKQAFKDEVLCYIERRFKGPCLNTDELAVSDSDSDEPNDQQHQHGSHTRDAIQSAQQKFQTKRQLEFNTLKAELCHNFPDMDFGDSSAVLNRYVDPFCGCTVCQGPDSGIIHSMANCLIKLGLPRLPPIPTPSKWTKLGPTLDFTAVGQLCFGFLPKVFQSAFEAVVFQTIELPNMNASEVQLVQELQFREVSSIRCKRSAAFLNNSSAMSRVVLLAVCSEAIRMLTIFFISCARTVQSTTRYPKLMDILNPPYSKLVVAQQYLSSMLMADSKEPNRLLLFVRCEGFDSIEDWEQHCRGTRASSLRMARRSIMLVSGWNYRRHSRRIDSESFNLVVLADDRASASLKQRIRNSFDSKRICCVLPGMPYVLKLRGIDSDTLCGPKLLSLKLECVIVANLLCDYLCHDRVVNVWSTYIYLYMSLVIVNPVV
jgi:hypothetical protein